MGSRAAMSITPADEVARRLLAAGARTTARNVAGCDCVEYARVHSDEKRHDNAAPIVAMLEKARALERRMHLWSLFALVAGKLAIWHVRACLRVYAPGAAGALEAAEDFKKHSRAKIQRVR